MNVGDIVVLYNLIYVNYDWHQEDNENVYIITLLKEDKTKAYNLSEIMPYEDENQVDFLRNTSFEVTKIIETKVAPYRKFYLQEI